MIQSKQKNTKILPPLGKLRGGFFSLVEEGCGYVTGIDVLSVSLIPVDPPPVEREREREKGNFGNLICCPPLKRYTLLD